MKRNVTIQKVEYYLTNDNERAVKLTHKEGCVNLHREDYNRLLKGLGRRTLRGMEVILANECEECDNCRINHLCTHAVIVQEQRASVPVFCALHGRMYTSPPASSR